MMPPSFLVHKRFFKHKQTAADLPWTNTAILQPIRTNVFFIILEPLIASGQTFRGILRPGVILL